MEFRIAARQPAGVAVVRRSLVGQRREEADLRPGGAPAVQQMRVEERECRVPRHRDALSRRRMAGGASIRHRAPARPARPATGSIIDPRVRGDEIRNLVQPRVEIAGFARLHQPEVPLRQRDVGRSRQGADDRNAQCLDRLGRQPGMPGAADAG